MLPMASFKSYTVNGVRYSSLDEMPADVRRMFEDADGDGVPDAFEDMDVDVVRSNVVKTRYTVNGEEVDSFEDLPALAREMLADGDGDGLPDFVRSSSSKTTRARHVTRQVTSDEDPRKQVRRILIIGGVLLAVAVAFMVGWLVEP